MMKEQVRAVLDRVFRLAGGEAAGAVRVVLEIEAEIAGAPYHATPDELKAIDEGLDGEAASEDEVSAAFADAECD